MILTSTVRNQYQTTPFIDESVSPGVTYYYTAYSCSIDGVYNLEESPSVSSEPTSYKVMTVVIDLRDANPETCGHYEDDAVDMPNGTSANEMWRDFFGYKPCILKDGEVTRYLNPNDYNYDENGKDSVDITSGNTGDVMVEFPRRGIKISKSGKVIRVSMTDDPDNPEFTYYAHTRGEARRDYFYLGAYAGSSMYKTTGEHHIRSLSGQGAELEGIEYTNYLRQYIHEECPAGYELMTFYQWTYIQAMYCLQYCGKLNYNDEVGVGWYYPGTGSYTPPETGSCNTKGLTYGSSDAFEVTKLFGLEALIPYYSSSFIDGFYIDKNSIVWTTTDNFNDEGSGYTNQGKIATENGGWISDVVASPELGFIGSEYVGSSSTYFCDSGGFSPVESSTKTYVVCINTSDEQHSHGIFSFATDTIYYNAISRLSFY